MENKKDIITDANDMITNRDIKVIIYDKLKSDSIGLFNKVEIIENKIIEIREDKKVEWEMPRYKIVAQFF